VIEESILPGGTMRLGRKLFQAQTVGLITWSRGKARIACA
jgi:hypothetical protein